MRKVVITFLVIALASRALAAPVEETAPPSSAADATPETTSTAPVVAPAAPTAPPNVAAGERYDGLTLLPKTSDYLLAVPRALLMPPRLLEQSLGAAMKPALEWLERDRVMQRFHDATTSADGLVGVLPLINYQAAFKPSAGVSYFNNRIPDVHLTVSTAMGGPEIVSQSVHATIKPPRLHTTFDIDTRFIRRDDELFTGVGMDNRAPFTRYSIYQGDLRTGASWKVHRVIQLGSGVDFGVRRFGNGDQYDGDRPIEAVYCPGLPEDCSARRVDDAKVPGFNEGTQFLRPHVDAHVDSRRDQLSSGQFVDLKLSYSHGIFGDDSSYLRAHGRVGTSVEIWHHRAIYLAFSTNDEIPFGHAPIPFSELVVLGGPNDLRGFRQDRFRDQSSLLLTAEYRWPVWIWMDASLFCDYGGVAGSNYSGVRLSELRPDVGVGFVVHTNSAIMMKIQLGYGFGNRGGTRFVVAGADIDS
jgi:Omp85 superfamily domain